jgi:exonuclease VII large subunit
MLNPQTVLKRGYTITYINDIPFTDKISAKPGDTVTTFTHNKSLKSKVVEIRAISDEVD